MYSRLGQGMASCMETANDLAKSLAVPNNVESSLDIFSEKSIQEGHAATNLNLLAHVHYGIFSSSGLLLTFRKWAAI